MTAPTRIANAIREGGAAIGARTVTRSSTFIGVYAELGFDFTWVDLEHGGMSPLDTQAVEPLVWAAEAADIGLLVRLPSGDPHVVRKVLDTGVRSVLVPRVETAEEVRTAVEAARFTYQDEPGDRGVASSKASKWGADFEGYADREDRSTTVGVMIENRTAVDNLEEILAVPELGFVFIGPADLSVSLGKPLEIDDPEVQATIGEIRETGLEADVPVGRIVNDADGAIGAIDDGYSILRIGGEVGATRTVLGGRLAAVRAGRQSD